MKWVSDNCHSGKLVKNDSCVVEILNKEWTQFNVISKCSFHSSIQDNELLESLLNECHKRADFLREMYKDDELSGEVLENGKFVRVLKVEPKYIWSGEGKNRTLKVEGLPEGKEEIIKDKIKNG